MRLHAALLPLLAAVVLSACTGTAVVTVIPSTQAPTPPPSTTGGPILPAGTFVSTSVTGHQLVAGSTVTLVNDGNLSVHAGCNTMSGPVGFDRGTLVLGQMATTEMACAADLMAQDQWLAAFLQGAAFSYGPDATLTLSKDGVVMTFANRSVENLPLEGTTWSVVGLVSGETVSSVPAGVTPMLWFAKDRVEIDTGCNTGAGLAAVAGDTVTFSAVGLTRMACTTWAGAVERHMVKVLAGSQHFSISGDALTLGGAGDGLQLTGVAGPYGSGNPGPS